MQVEQIVKVTYLVKDENGNLILKASPEGTTAIVAFVDKVTLSRVQMMRLAKAIVSIANYLEMDDVSKPKTTGSPG